MPQSGRPSERMKNHTSSLPKAIICDLDGTLALLGNRSPYDASTAEEDLLNHPIANILEVYSHQKEFEIAIILVTGREDIYREPTKRWLAAHSIKYDALHMREAGDRRKDTVVKKEIYRNFIEPEYDVLFVLEDRDQVVGMWRKELKLTCLQVEYGDF
jgi:uncharacterized HAD superfamily protein